MVRDRAEWLPFMLVEGVSFFKDDSRMSNYLAASLKSHILTLCISILLLLLSGLPALLLATDEISVTREKEKTIYTIDSGDENRLEQERERDKAWDMLKNMPVVIDKGLGPPRKEKPPQVAPGK